METYTMLWIGWGALFVMIEGAALVNKRPGDTLSEHIWKIFSIKEKPKDATEKRIFRTRKGLLGALMALGSAHFFGLI